MMHLSYRDTKTAPVRKHRAPKGALRLAAYGYANVVFHMSESTERQKEHLDALTGNASHVSS